MKRHKMSLDVEYVKDWSIQDALRELFQNAIDYNDWEYVFVNSELHIISKGTELDIRSLLLGHSKKSSEAIGKFGEGYKLAMLVLTRLGFKAQIISGNSVWYPKIIDSRTYKAKQLVFDIDTTENYSPDLIFVVQGITEEIMQELRERNLHVAPPSSFDETQYGQILPSAYAGKIYVNGLYVSTIQEMKYGYNFKPKYLTLDRDRRIVRDFDIQWLSCQMWSELNNIELILELIKQQASDVKYLDSFTYSAKQSLADKAAEEFMLEHGEEAIPVVYNTDIDIAKREGHEKIVIVPKVTQQLIERSSIWTRPAPKVIRKSPREILLDFNRKHCLSEEAQEDFEEILQLAESWSN